MRASRIHVSGHAPSPSPKFDGSVSGVRAKSVQHPNMVRASFRRPSTSDESLLSESSRTEPSDSNSDYARFVPRLNSIVASRLFLTLLSFLCNSLDYICFVCRAARQRRRGPPQLQPAPPPPPRG